MTTQKIVGWPVWHDLMTPDADASVRFYSELAGWKTRRQDFGAAGFYITFSVADANAEGGIGRDVGGMVPYQADDGFSPHWFPYLLVNDVDAVTGKSTQGGGKVRVPARDIKDKGRFSMVLDPNGAEVATMSLLEEKAEPAMPFPVGEFGWELLLTPDPEAAKNYYTTAFDYVFEPAQAGTQEGSVTAFRIRRQGGNALGEASVQPRASANAEWVSFIVVADVDERTAQAEKLGARIERPPTDLDGVGRLSVIVDPQGARFGLIKPA